MLLNNMHHFAKFSDSLIQRARGRPARAISRYEGSAEMIVPRRTLSFLQQIGLFSRLDRKAIGDFVDYLSERRLARGSLLFQEGDMAHSLFIVHSGLLKVIKYGPEDKSITLRVAMPGALLGEVAVLDGSPYPASAEAIENAVVLELTRSNLLTFLQRHPEASLCIMAILVERLRDAYTALRGMATDNIERRISIVLLNLVERGSYMPCAGPISISLTRQDIAEMVGCAKESVSRSMARMKRSGVVKGSRGKVVLASAEKLRQFCATHHLG